MAIAANTPPIIGPGDPLSSSFCLSKAEPKIEILDDS